MNEQDSGRLPRRDFLKTAASVAGVLAGSARQVMAGGSSERLLAGEGIVDITPPLGIEMGGFHRPPGKERRIKSIRQPAAVRALVLQFGETQVAICSLDVAAVGQEMAVRVQNEVARQTGIPAPNVRVCATHTHSMPGFCFLRQWGAIPKEFMATVEQQAVEAVRQAKDDLGAAEVALGKCRVTGGNHNRTSKTCKTDERFTENSTDDDRWLDTVLHALLPGPTARRFVSGSVAVGTVLQGRCSDHVVAGGRDIFTPGLHVSARDWSKACTSSSIPIARTNTTTATAIMRSSI